MHIYVIKCIYLFFKKKNQENYKHKIQNPEEAGERLEQSYYREIQKYL